ncbi:hypothetical protein SLS62_010750 [Diatrype stigma]|uniref:beta-N-acetylhexosaminidase n=1 Tax=Diatrype stigma TaxID=117547 RepID=A0AAN9UA04_9PEZI
MALLQPLLPPPLSVNIVSTAPAFDFSKIPRTVFITSDLATRRDSEGLTLIPPSGLEFAQTFVDDLTELTGDEWTLKVTDKPGCVVSGIFMATYDGEPAKLAYENGTPTEEGYTLEVAGRKATIRGAGSRGAWWGTRTLLQQLVIANWTSLPELTIEDAPAYATRGFLLDAGRKWYSKDFLKELCTYASFFKMSEFHYHTSDNYPLNRGRNDTWQDVYAQFSLRPESPELQGLVQRPDETLSREDFEDLQQHAARRGITIVPEIEAPGHCLTITKWKPELALDKKDLLNLTHPESVPTVKRIWAEFLPWFQTKEVHIGADEYDATLADDYITFVNEMAKFVRETSGKRIRIWGTEEPSDNLTISKDVVVQHWQYGQSDPVELQNSGYDLINSQDWWAYMSLKNDHMPILPAPYAQFFNESRVLNFADVNGWQWQPALFNQVNTTEQLEAGASGNRGAIMAAWNDNGPDATTQLEAYYAMRRGIPLVGAKAWSGARGPQLDAATVDESIDFLSAHAPAQNLDRKLPGQNQNSSTAGDGELVSWTRGSGGGTDSVVELGYGSKGVNYTLTISAVGPFTLSSSDATLMLSQEGGLTFEADRYQYPLRSVAEDDGFDAGQPGRIWANATSSTHEPVTVALPAEITITGDTIGGSRVWVDGTFVGRFEVYVFGGKNTMFSWSQMAFVAPLETLEGGIQKLVVRQSISPPSALRT